MSIDKLRNKVEKIKADIIIEKRARDKLYDKLKEYGINSEQEALDKIDRLSKAIGDLIIREAEALNAANRMMDNIDNGKD